MDTGPIAIMFSESGKGHGVVLIFSSRFSLADSTGQWCDGV